ncbi:hypothetical protein SNEBB_006869 [Seison nebaliae]|nr:hypothetical protein SNEBB_006869 [Seison nebaliae]
MKPMSRKRTNDKDEIILHLNENSSYFCKNCFSEIKQLNESKIKSFDLNCTIVSENDLANSRNQLNNSLIDGIWEELLNDYKKKSPTRENGREEVQKKRRKLEEDISSETKDEDKRLVYGIGQNLTGQLCGSPEELFEVSKYRAIKLGNDSIKMICCGAMHSVIITNDSSIITFGCNDEGALGIRKEEENNSQLFYHIQLNHQWLNTDHIIKCIAGDSFTSVLTFSGRLFLWGTFRDANGICGLIEPNEISFTPKEVILKGKKMVDVVGGFDHILILTSDNFLYSMGNGEQGQLGRIGELKAKDPEKKALNEFLQLKQINFTPKIKYIFAGGYGSIIVTINNECYGFGLNNYHQLGIQKKDEEDNCVYFPRQSHYLQDIKWNNISMSLHHSMGLSMNGDVYGFGRSDDGRLGVINEQIINREDIKFPIKWNFPCKFREVRSCLAGSFAITLSGALVSSGTGDTMMMGHGEHDKVEGTYVEQLKRLEKSNCISVAAGGQHSLILIK